MKHIKYNQAVALLREGKNLGMYTRDATGQHTVSFTVWLAGDQIMMGHPTDTHGPDVAVPTSATFQTWTDSPAWLSDAELDAAKGGA